MTRRRNPRTSVIRLSTGHAAHATHYPFPHRTPVLALDFGACAVLLTPGDQASSDDLAFARQLAREATRYARAVERLLHEPPTREEIAA